ncbi:MAG: hypothetical protein IPG72_04880 [Ardenticatenales bacterium]|nr:hypothetical protein [Ardenticatenales bacterium]
MFNLRSAVLALSATLVPAALALAALAAGALALPPRPAAGQPAPLPHRIHLPRVVRAEPPYTSPPTARPTSAAPTGTPTSSAVPTDNATPSPTGTQPKQPGVPACGAPKGDAGGFRFSLDGGRTLSPGAQRLAPLAYTWAIDIDPRDPDHIVELHAGQLFHSHDAGCTFTRPVPLPDLGGDATGLTRAAAAPDTLVLHSIFSHDIAITDDGGRTWTVETLPDDVVALAIAPNDAARWTFVGREGIYVRTARDAKWEARRVGGDDASLGGVIHTASAAPGRWGTWLVGGLDGIVRTTDDGLSWRKVDAAMREGGVGTPPQPITVVVGVWVTHAPSDPERGVCRRQPGQPRPVPARHLALRGRWPDLGAPRHAGPARADGRGRHAAGRHDRRHPRLRQPARPRCHDLRVRHGLRGLRHGPLPLVRRPADAARRPLQRLLRGLHRGVGTVGERRTVRRGVERHPVGQVTRAAPASRPCARSGR